MTFLLLSSSIGVQEGATITTKKSNFYTNEVLCAWDYSIREQETATHFHHQLVFELKVQTFVFLDKSR